MAPPSRSSPTASRPCGSRGDDVFVDFMAQNQIYGFEVAGDIAREKLVGFELKKNVSIHYKDRDLLDKIVVAAARSQVYRPDQGRLRGQGHQRRPGQAHGGGRRIIKQKSARYEKLLGIKLQPPGQVYAERPRSTTRRRCTTPTPPGGGGITPANRQKYTVQSARKSRTFFFNGLDGDGFDSVINPVVIEPVVQFTLYLKVKYDVAR